ncbi:hypothetical protein [Thalassoglobus polymorphus]|uniref:hypothetical protein n=1 Tax=Thalassoglobus polymorphus TaxID=2527994 RepID=UPI0011A410D4|nr:hypothetical protein [Thalassoglobus polymorphus]
MTESQKKANARPAKISLSDVKDFGLTVNNQQIFDSKLKWSVDQSVTFSGHFEPLNDQEFEQRLIFFTIAFRPDNRGADGDWDLKKTKDAASEIHLPIVKGKVESDLPLSSVDLDAGNYQLRVYYNSTDFFGGDEPKVQLLGTAQLELTEE